MNGDELERLRALEIEVEHLKRSDRFIEKRQDSARDRLDKLEERMNGFLRIYENKRGMLSGALMVITASWAIVSALIALIRLKFTGEFPGGDGP